MGVGVARERMAAAGPRLREQSWRARALVRSRLARARGCGSGGVDVGGATRRNNRVGV